MHAWILINIHILIFFSHKKIFINNTKPNRCLNQNSIYHRTGYFYFNPPGAVVPYENQSWLPFNFPINQFSLIMESWNLPPDEMSVDGDSSQSNNLVLDLTSCQLRDLDSVVLPPSLTELDLTANRLSALDPRISNLSSLQKLSLRQNLFNDYGVRPLSTWHSISGLQVRIYLWLPQR